jgi:hypothetical protein
MTNKNRGEKILKEIAKLVLRVFPSSPNKRVSTTCCTPDRAGKTFESQMMLGPEMPLNIKGNWIASCNSRGDEQQFSGHPGLNRKRRPLTEATPPQKASAKVLKKPAVRTHGWNSSSVK